MFGNFVQKAVYMGLGLASYAGEKAGETLSELQGRMQELTDELVQRGEMSAEEARRMVDEAVAKAQEASPMTPPSSSRGNAGPRPIEIEILDDEEGDEATQGNAGQTTGEAQDRGVDRMRQQVRDLEDELRRLQRP